MSVFPQFLQHIQDLGIYVEGYNYEEMYNVMVNNLINNFIPSHNFIYTYAQVEELYNLLDELLNPIQTDIESNNIEVIETNETSQIYPENDWSDEETEVDPNQNDNTNIINIINPNQNMQYYYNIQINHQGQSEQHLIHYLNNLNNMNNINMNNNNLN